MAMHTYPDPRVTRFINDFAVPVQFNAKEDPGAHLRYHAFWTPCLILQDVDGNEHRRSIGPLTAEQFLAEFSLAYGLRFLNTGNFGKAIELLQEALNHTPALPARHAENIYFVGVAKFVPVIVTELPSAPEAGSKPVTVGAGIEREPGAVPVSPATVTVTVPPVELVGTCTVSSAAVAATTPATRPPILTEFSEGVVEKY